MNYLDQLIINSKKAIIAEPIKYYQFNVNDCQNFDVLEFDKLKKYKFVIYIITEINGNTKITYDLMKQFKSNNSKEYKCSKINQSKSDILYVGSSTTGIKNRLEQHLGYKIKAHIHYTCLNGLKESVILLFMCMIVKI